MYAIFLSGPVDLLPLEFLYIYSSLLLKLISLVWFLNIWICAMLTSQLQKPDNNETKVTSFANVHLLSLKLNLRISWGFGRF